MRIILKSTPPILFQQNPCAKRRVGGGELPKSSAFPAKTPNSRGRGSSQGDKPAWAPRFSSNTGERSASSAQGGRNRGAINRHPPLKPPGTIKTSTKDKTKLKEKNTPSIVYNLRSLPSLPKLLTLEDGGPVREISLLHGLPVSHQTQVRDLRVLPKVVEIAVQ